MSKCVICKINEAIIYATRNENGKTITEGFCLKCAYDTGIGGVSEYLKQAGINDDNIDDTVKQLNELLANQGLSDPLDMLRFLSKQNTNLNELPNDSSLMFQNMMSNNDDSDDDDEYDDANSKDMQDSSDDSFDADYYEGILADLDKQTGSTSNMSFLEIRKAMDEVDQMMDEEEEAKKSNEKAPKGKTSRTKKNKKPGSGYKFLNQYGINLTAKAREGKIDRVIGRDRELERVVQILNRRSKNNPALLGAPGVGKTAIAEGLAVRIVEGKVPAKLLEMQVFLLDMMGMVAGTQFRGQFESRMKGLVDEASKDGNIILVIDEMHNIMGAGDAEGAMNAANILKPALSKGQIRVLGSTTLDEYRRFIEKDSALERRFQKVVVDEPSEEESVEILKGIKDYYETHHHVTYSDEVLAYAVHASSRYIMDRFLPDKAIDLIDEAGSRANLEEVCLVKIKKLSLEKMLIERTLAKLEELMIELSPEKIEERNLYQKQAELKAEILRVERELESLKNDMEPTIINKEDISRVVEMWTGIPVKRISESDSELLMKLEERLHKRVIGQNEAVNALARAIRRNRSGFGKKHKPSSFIFVGPTGVGKTELVKAIAEAMFAREDALIRLDMSEFMEAHTVSKLIGSPPGYVGYDDGGQLTERVRRKPYSVILFDEIEKAHPDVFNMLLQILDDGRLTDSHGRLVNFENTILIMTSNAGTTLKSNGFGFGADGRVALESRVHSVLKEMFRPEFLNRIDEIIVFNELSKDEIRQIVNLMLVELSNQLKEKEISVKISEKAKDQLAIEGYDSKYGARPLRKTIQKKLEDPLSDYFLTGELNQVSDIAIDYRDGKYTFDFTKRKDDDNSDTAASKDN